MLKIILIRRDNPVSTRPSSLRYRIRAISDMGTHIQIQIIEDVETEEIDQAEQIIAGISQNPDIPEEMKKAMDSLLKPYLKQVFQYIPTQAQARMAAGQITLNIPRRLYEQIGRPSIGDIIAMELRKEPIEANTAR